MCPMISETLLAPLSILFDKIYNTCTIPEQRKVYKIILIFKKGNRTEIENYRPIANLCSTSKFFEKLILKQIHYLESTNKHYCVTKCFIMMTKKISNI